MIEYVVLILFVFLAACKGDLPVSNEQKSIEQDSIDSVLVFNLFTDKNSNNLSFDNDILNYKVKQIDQFIDRFNFKENFKGQRINKALTINERIENISHLFDNRFLVDCDTNLVIQFIENICLEEKNIALSDPFVFSKISYNVLFKNNPSNIEVTLKYQTNSDTTFQWVLAGLNGEFLNMDIFAKQNNILYPNAHEFNFLRLNKSLQDNKDVVDLMPSGFSTDFNSILLYLLHAGDLEVQEIKSHEIQFLQIKDWIFKVKFIDRFEENSGWLIYEIFQISDSIKNEYLAQQLHVTNRKNLFDYPIGNSNDNKKKRIDFNSVDQQALKNIVKKYATCIENLTATNQVGFQGEVDSLLSLFVSPEARVVNDLLDGETDELISIRSYLGQIVQMNLDTQLMKIDFQFDSELPIRFEERDSNYYALINVIKNIRIEGEVAKEIKEIIIIDLRNKKIANTSNNFSIKSSVQ